MRLRSAPTQASRGQRPILKSTHSLSSTVVTNWAMSELVKPMQKLPMQMVRTHPKNLHQLLQVWLRLLMESTGRVGLIVFQYIRSSIVLIFTRPIWFELYLIQSNLYQYSNWKYLMRRKHFKTEEPDAMSPEKPKQKDRNQHSFDNIINQQRMTVWVKVTSCDTEQEQVLVPDNKSVLFLPSTDAKMLNYSFDRAFNASESNRAIFRQLQPLLESFVLGYNLTLISNGLITSGKYDILLSTQKEKGVVEYTLEKLFKRVEGEGKGLGSYERETLLKVSCVDISNEIMSDVLSECAGVAEVRDLGERGVVISKQIEIRITQWQDIQIILKKIKQKKTGKECSSHLIIQILLQQKPTHYNVDEEVISKLLFVDLASPEAHSKSISQSLLVLNNCITQLSKNCESRGHVPFRNSKLTRILKESLDGNAKTVMLCTVLAKSSDGTTTTLNFALKCTSIRTKPKKNSRKNQEIHVGNYDSVIKALKDQNQSIKKELVMSAPDINESQRLCAHFQELLNKEIEYYSTYNDIQDRITYKEDGQISSARELLETLDQSVLNYQGVHTERMDVMDKIKAYDSELFKTIQGRIVEFQLRQLAFEKQRNRKVASFLQGRNKEMTVLMQQLKRKEYIIAQQKSSINRMSPITSTIQKSVQLPMINSLQPKVKKQNSHIPSNERSMSNKVATEESSSVSISAKNRRQEFKIFLEGNIQKYQSLSRKK